MGEDLQQLSRRTWFKLAGAGAALAGLGGCSSRPAREIRPYVNQPPELTPGVPRYFATALVEDGFATGVVVEAHEGRPTKLEGNPDHPSSLGATRAIEQAAVLGLYDPQRAQAITDHGLPATWAAVTGTLAAAMQDAARDGGAGVHVVIEPTTSLVVRGLLDRLRARLPALTVTAWSPFALRHSLAGHRIAFGRPLQAQYDLRAADVVVALDADLAAEGPLSLVYARQLADRRRVRDAHSPMNRIYALEPAFTPTGVLADHRIPVRGLEIEGLAAQLLGELGALGHGPAVALPALARAGTPWLAAIARDLVAHAGRAVVVAGERQPPVVHAMVAAINAAIGAPVTYRDPLIASDELAPLVAAGERGAVRTLIVLGGNPVYTAPGGLALPPGATTFYCGPYANETAAASRFVIPELHALESWDAVRAYDGTLTPVQPLIEPLFAGKAIADVLEACLGEPPVQTPRERARLAWAAATTADFDAALALGCAANTASPAIVATLDGTDLPLALAAAGKARLPAVELELRPHPFVHDGRYANHAWLQELPEPMTKLTWGNAAQLSPVTAARLEVDDGDWLSLIANGREIYAAAIIVPGHADGSITLHAGYGRTGAEAIARDVGRDVFAIWPGAFQLAVAVSTHSGHREFALTQVNADEDHRDVARAGTLGQLGDRHFLDDIAEQRTKQPTLYTSRAGITGPQWAMSIDLTTCTGCTACVMACAAENNTPVVGADQVRRGRAMHWLRIDRYITDDRDVHMQPMTCQHCEDAPCEYVCPVEATTHSPDGLNEMTYNRCVGTRFCSNNCPYKVRRFNWFDYKQHTGLQILGKNPDVTIRDRGVMEKCTYCVQRIRRAEIDARVAKRTFTGTEVKTACQQACPTQAIAFGSLTDADGAIVEQRQRPHSYEVLHSEGTRPRTTYLARIKNPNPELG